MKFKEFIFYKSPINFFIWQFLSFIFYSLLYLIYWELSNLIFEFKVNFSIQIFQSILGMAKLFIIFSIIIYIFIWIFYKKIQIKNLLLFFILSDFLLVSLSSSLFIIGTNLSIFSIFNILFFLNLIIAFLCHYFANWALTSPLCEVFLTS
jgi:hypothetical protein